MATTREAEVNTGFFTYFPEVKYISRVYACAQQFLYPVPVKNELKAATFPCLHTVPEWKCQDCLRTNL